MREKIGTSHDVKLICNVFCACLLWLASAAISKGQVQLEPESKPERDTTVRISVDEVRIDAVVLDWKGHQITDLTTDDFTIYQDGIRQEIVSCTYVNDFVPRRDRKIPMVSAPAPSRDEIRRTMLFLVDDYSMSLENLYYTRMALTNFVKKQMQPGDLVGILRTGNGSGSPFTSDKRELSAAIEKIQWGAPQALASCGPGG